MKNNMSIMVKNIIVFGVLVFSVSALSFCPWGSGWRYVSYVLAPLSAIYLLLNYRSIDWQNYGKSLLYFCAPFLPYLLAYIVICLIHGFDVSDDGTSVNRFTFIIFVFSIVFGVICQNQRVSKSLFFTSCAIASVLYFVDVVFTASLHGVPVWTVKTFVVPYSTIYARCISLVSGLSILGFFLLPSDEKKLRWFCLLASLLGFCTSVGFIEVRAVILVPFFALIIGYIFSPLKRRTKVLASIFVCVISGIVIVNTPMLSRMKVAYKEAVSVVSTDAVKDTLSSINKEKTSPQEQKKQKYLNTSVGARLAVWGVAEKAIKKNVWVGTGKGSPGSFVNIKKLFKFSGDYLKHFHSDYVQVTIVGGIILLFSFLLTQFWLLIRSYKEPLTLFMTISMVSYGIFDNGFLDLKSFACYLGASLIVWSWYYPNPQAPTEKYYLQDRERKNG